MKKMNKKQKDELKARLLKALHVVTYVLSAGFVVLMVLVGVNSCHQRQTQSLSADVVTSVEVQSVTNTTWYLNDRLNVHDDFNYIVNYTDIEGVSYNRFVAYDQLLIYRNSEPFYDVTVYDDFDYWNDTEVHRTVTFGTGSDSDNHSLIEWLYNNATLLNTMSYFEFNKAFNYNAPLNTTVDGVYGNASYWSGGGDNIKYIDYNIGDFYSNGEYFNKMTYRAISTTGVSVYINGEIVNAPLGYYVYGWLEYVNTNSGRTVVVNSHDQLPYNNNGGVSTYYANSSTWLNDSYRHVTILGDIPNTLRVNLNAFNNNNQTSYSGTVTSGDLFNVFTLISSAFTGLIPLLSIMILPDITIGMLLFVPIVAMLVFAIVKIIKK